MAGVLIVCQTCHGGGSIANDYGVRMSNGTTGSATVVGGCRHCKGTGRIMHPGVFRGVSERGRGDAHEEACGNE